MLGSATIIKVKVGKSCNYEDYLLLFNCGKATCSVAVGEGSGREAAVGNWRRLE